MAPHQTKLRPCIVRFCKVFLILLLVGGCSLLSASIRRIPDGFLSFKKGSADVKQGLYMELPWESQHRYNMPTHSEVKIATITKFNGNLSRLQSLMVSQDCKVKYKITNVKAFAHHLKVKNMDVIDFNRALIFIYTKAAEQGKINSLKKLYPFLKLNKMVCTKKPTLFKFKQRSECSKGKGKATRVNYRLTEVNQNGTRIPTEHKYVTV